MKATTTLKKLSASLGLSISTVSRALKNHPDISEATRKRVWELAQVTEYEPNTYAINLRTNNSKVFGLIVPDISNFFYDSVISSLEEEARRHGYSLLILQSSDDPAIELMNIRFCKQNRVSGVFAAITKGTSDISSFLKLQEAGIKVIFIDKVPSAEIVCNRICMDDRKAAELAAATLYQKKKKHILSVFGNSRMSITQERLKSYKDFFGQQGLRKTKLVFAEADTNGEAYKVALAALQQAKRPDAVFCMSDEILTGVMKAVQQLKLSLPDELGVIAISNGILPHYYYPDITFVETSGYKLGKLAYSRMMACLSGSSFIQNLKVDAVLVEGQSL